MNLVELSQGDWFSSEKVEESISNIIDRASELGFAFVDVIPKIKKRNSNRMDVVFDIIEGNKVYIYKIDISGNLKTEDKIIRKQIEFIEGDSFNISKIRKSEQNLRTLGMFENVGITFDESVDNNKTNLNVEVTEKSTGEFSIGAGYSSLDGAIGNFN